jgi:uncharacterized protein
MAKLNPHIAAAQIVHDAGGELVGRTRLQKIAFLLNVAGFEDSFSFEYKHYGPFSEGLAQAIEIASLLGPVVEEERSAEWGGKYSVYKLDNALSSFVDDPVRKGFVQEAKTIDAIEIELAATAAFLFLHERIGNGVAGNPWLETKRRKPNKAAGGRLERAAQAYESLRKLETLKPLPDLPKP